MFMNVHRRPSASKGLKAYVKYSPSSETMLENGGESND
jgi:hypothetical protein